MNVDVLVRARRDGSHACGRAWTANLRVEGLRLGSIRSCSILWEDDGLTPRELSNRLSVEMPTVTRTVQRMLRDGLVQREDHPSDARSVYIRLTEKGNGLRPMIRRLLDHETGRMLEGFTEEERLQLVNLLERMLTNTR